MSLSGPVGHATVCTETSVELVSSDLASVRVLLTDSSKFSACRADVGMAPSRTAIGICDFVGLSKKSRCHLRLLSPDSDQPLAEHQFAENERLVGITDSGYALCALGEKRNCERLTVDGRIWVIGFPAWEFDHKRGDFLSPDELLLPHTQTDKSLISVSPNGAQQQVINLKDVVPINVDNPGIQLSATYPRRILYTATGCRIGDFDDCYGLIFNRFAVLDPKTHQVLFKKDAGQYSKSIISPNGHMVVTLDKTELHIYTIP